MPFHEKLFSCIKPKEKKSPLSQVNKNHQTRQKDETEELDGQFPYLNVQPGSIYGKDFPKSVIPTSSFGGKLNPTSPPLGKELEYGRYSFKDIALPKSTLNPYSAQQGALSPESQFDALKAVSVEKARSVQPQKPSAPIAKQTSPKAHISSNSIEPDILTNDIISAEKVSRVLARKPGNEAAQGPKLPEYSVEDKFGLPAYSEKDPLKTVEGESLKAKGEQTNRLGGIKESSTRVQQPKEEERKMHINSANEDDTPDYVTTNQLAAMLAMELLENNKPEEREKRNIENRRPKKSQIIQARVFERFCFEGEITPVFINNLILNKYSTK